MKKTMQLVLSLTVISAVCAAVLAVVNSVTKERIANIATLKANAAARAVLSASVKAIVPRNDPADESLTAFIGYADDAKTKIAGYAVPGLTSKGYGGNIRLMVGLNPDRTVISYQTLAAGETPGLGSNLSLPSFIARFKGQSAATVAVTKDGGKIEALTSATITSRAVCDAIADAARRIDRIEGKTSAAPSAAAPKANPEGKMLFDPAKSEEALKVLPKGTVSAVALSGGKGRFPVFEGKDAAGKTTGYAAVGTGKATGPHGELVILYQFGFTARCTPSFNPPPRMANQPAVEMTDMENAQRTAYNAAMQDAMAQLRGN